MAARQRMCTRGHGSFKDDDPRNVTKRAWRARNGGPAAGQRTGRPMALRQTTAERGGSRGATAGTDRAGCGPMVEVPRCFLSTLKAGVFLSAQTRLETALLAGRPHRGMECRQRLWMSITGSSSIRRLKDCPVESGPERARPSRRAARGRETRAAVRAVRRGAIGSCGSAPDR